MRFAQSALNKLASKGPELGSKDTDSKGTNTPIEALYEDSPCPIEGLSAEGHCFVTPSKHARGLFSNESFPTIGPCGQTNLHLKETTSPSEEC